MKKKTKQIDYDFEMILHEGIFPFIETLKAYLDGFQYLEDDVEAKLETVLDDLNSMPDEVTIELDEDDEEEDLELEFDLEVIEDEVIDFEEIKFEYFEVLKQFNPKKGFLEFLDELIIVSNVIIDFLEREEVDALEIEALRENVDEIEKLLQEIKDVDQKELLKAHENSLESFKESISKIITSNELNSENK